MTRLLCLAVCASTAVAEEPLRTAGDRPVDVTHIRLDLDVDLEQQTVSGTAALKLVALRPLTTFTLDAVGHEIQSVAGGPAGTKPVKLDSDYDGKRLTVEFPEPVAKGATWDVAIAYRVREPKEGLHFFRPTDAEPDTPTMVWSQGEPTSNRYWFPCVDHPNERQTTEIRVRVPAGYEVLSNGKLVSRTELDDGRVRFHWQQDKPHVSYLVTLVVGKFVVGREEWRGRPVTYYVEPHRADDTRTTFGRTQEMLDFFSERFGVEYPWAQYAQVVVEQFTSGGMENTSATTLYQGVMHDERALLDGTPDRLIAHELGHQWWGDLVTCKDWSHLWLNEGFATYCEVLWWEHKLGQDERDYLLYSKSKSARSGAALKRPVVDRRYDEPWDMFDERAYPKGGWVLHMLRSRLGDEEFFGALKRYATIYAYRTAETADLRSVFEETTGYGLERFFYDWTQRPGHPVLKVKTSYEAADRLVKVEVEQTQDGEAFHFPLTVELQCESGSPVVVDHAMTEKQRTYYVPVPSRPKLVRVDPGLTVLAEIDEEKSRDLWKSQALGAPTVAERIRAVEHFGESHDVPDVELLGEVLKDDPFYGVRIEAAKALGKTGGDTARDVLLAALGQEEPRVRAAVTEALGKFVGDKAVVAALAKQWEQGDRSERVQAETLSALAKTQRPPALEPLLVGLERESHLDAIRQAALKGLSESDDVRAWQTLLDWTRPGKPRDTRRVAMAALVDHLNRHEATPARLKQSLDALVECLDDDETSKVRQSAVEALRDLGRRARPALSVVRALAQHDPNGRVRTAAGKAATAIESDTSPSDELARLRKEVDELREKNTDLGDRLIKVETK